jgi:hypothetical protein
MHGCCTLQRPGARAACTRCTQLPSQRAQEGRQRVAARLRHRFEVGARGARFGVRVGHLRRHVVQQHVGVEPDSLVAQFGERVVLAGFQLRRVAGHALAHVPKPTVN